MSYLESQGTEFQIGDGASPEVFTKVGEVTDIDGPDGDTPEIDVTNLSSTKREYALGLPAEGNIEISGNWDPDNAQQTALRTAHDNRTVTNFKIVYSDSPATEDSFAGLVKTFNKSTKIDDVVKFTATIRVTGDITTT